MNDLTLHLRFYCIARQLVDHYFKINVCSREENKRLEKTRMEPDDENKM